MTDDLTPAQQASVSALRATRGPCPGGDVLVDYEACSDAERAAHPAHPHIVSCSRCQLTLLHMNTGETGGAGAAGWVRWALPVAAVAVLAVALTLIDRSPQVHTPPQNETVRGTELQPITPSGALEVLREFTWQSPIRAERYRVIVRLGTRVIWQTETTGLRVAPPPTGTIERDVQYEWVVEAVDREGNVRMTSPPQSFVVY